MCLKHCTIYLQLTCTPHNRKEKEGDGYEGISAGEYDYTLFSVKVLLDDMMTFHKCYKINVNVYNIIEKCKPQKCIYMCI